ncbi:TonB-dependent receptor [Cellulophaga baltica]|uniref:TonB-dependent receptor plug domain-containing protein n=1 Tax=Cellulophaga TaxID=104264 RepID=UPI001C0657D1|nr:MULTISPECIES: TonB-dependent receptor [Cellulophaga]MBU2995287.1 TonB-dependent receptor [Cellulophaga baltica]MDO6766682.1 TonB-dependent receptor [Cellulophaga sp. 1_MG-2023]
MNLNKNNCIFILCLFLNYILLAQTVKSDSTEIKQLDEVVITATRTIRQLSSLPLPVQIISKKDIESSNSIRLSDILNEQTGLITVPDYGGGEGIQLQGLDSQYTLILIDGVPLIGRSAGTLDITRLTVGNIKQIEVVKGASSSLYGSEALGGVINIITENPKKGLNGDINYRLGAYNTHDLNTLISYKKKKIGISTFINRYSSNGYDLDDDVTLKTVEPYSNYTFNSKLTYDISKKTKILLSGRYYTQNQDYVASEELKGESNINEWNARFKISHNYNKKWSSNFDLYTTRYIAKEYLDSISTGSRYSDSNYDQVLIRPEFRVAYHVNNKNSFIGGIGLNHETLDRDDFTEKPIFNSPYIYAQYDANPTDKLNLIIGARFDSHNKYKSQFSPKTAIRYQLSNKLAIKSSIGYGYKAPDFRQLYFDFTNATVGYTVLGYNAVATAIPELEAQGEISSIIVPISEFDSELKPESSVSINLGIDYTFNSKLTSTINFFRNNISNLIDTRVIANKTNGQNVYSYYNVNNVYTEGLEFNLKWNPTKNLKILGGYQLLYAKDKDAKEAFNNGEVYARDNNNSSFQLQKDDYYGLYNRSRHMSNLKIFYNIPKYKTDANIRTTYRSKYGLTDSNGNTYLDNYDDFVNGYCILDFSINKTFYKNYKLGFGIDNLFNFTDPDNITNIPGKLIYGKLKIHF